MIGMVMETDEGVTTTPGELPGDNANDTTDIENTERIAMLEAANEENQRLQTENAQLSETIAALNKRIGELVAHNYELMRSAGNSNDASANTTDTDDDVEETDPIDDLFEESE